MAVRRTAPRGFTNKQLDNLLSRQAEFWEWVKKLGRADLLPSNSPHGRLGYRLALALPHLTFPIHVIGLDTAWLCGDNHDARKLWLADGQVMKLAADSEGNQLPGFRLCLMHHPLSELADEGQCRRLLAEHVDVVLRGHLHEPEPSLWEDSHRTLREAAAGCLYENDTYPNSFQIIDVHTNESGQPEGYDLWFRTWSKPGHWFNDDGLYKGSRNGRLSLWVKVPSFPPIGTDLAVFVGRSDELIELDGALLATDGTSIPVAVCAVQGMPGVGKSHLAEEFVRRRRRDFPGGAQRIVLAFDDRRTATHICRELCDRLNLPGGADSWATLRQRLLEPRTLLLIENVDHVNAGRMTADVARALPGCSLLITGRMRGLGQTAGWRQVAIAPFGIKDGLAQLRAELTQVRFDDTDVIELVKSLGCLPLAIHLAAGHLRGGRTPAGFLRMLQETGLKLEPFDPADPMLADRARAVLDSSFALSLNALERAWQGIRNSSRRVTCGLIQPWLRTDSWLWPGIRSRNRWS